MNINNIYNLLKLYGGSENNSDVPNIISNDDILKNAGFVVIIFIVCGLIIISILIGTNIIKIF
jgi:hypothetical protein